MSHSLGYGTSSGDLNTGGNLWESSFLEALFGLEFGHADFADDADFFLQQITKSLCEEYKERSLKKGPTR